VNGLVHHAIHEWIGWMPAIDWCDADASNVVREARQFRDR
jgi:hypothetical protein